MRLEITRLLADWLASPTDGVLAQLAALPRDPGETGPTTLVVVDETRDEAVARGQDPLASSVLEVSVASVTYTADVQTAGTQYADVVVQLRWVTRQADTADAVRDGSYLARAVRRSLMRLLQPGGTAARTRNQVTLGQLVDDRSDGLFAPMEDEPASLGMTLTFTRCRDTAA